MSVRLSHQGMVSTVTFDHPPTNLMTIELMGELVRAHRQADQEPGTRVIVTRSAVADVFSNGLDPAYVVAMSPRQRLAIFHAVASMFSALVQLDKPHIAVINGPAMAGGAILAITADYRYFDADHGRISFSEPKVGLPIPYAVCQAIRAVVQAPMVRPIVMGRNCDAAFASESGLADGVARTTELDGLVGEQAARLARLSPAVLRETKRALRANVIDAAEQFEKDLGNFADFVGETFLGEGLRALLEGRHPNFTA